MFFLFVCSFCVYFNFLINLFLEMVILEVRGNIIERYVLFILISFKIFIVFRL